MKEIERRTKTQQKRLGVGKKEQERAMCQEGFATKAEIVEISPKLPLGWLNLLVIWRAKPKICNVRYAKANGALRKKKPTQK